MTVAGPILGPGVAWIEAADVAACCGVDASQCTGDEIGMFETVATEASQVLYEISGRQFTGLMESIVRPMRQPCGCFGQTASVGPWYWSLLGGSWGWMNECGDKMGCAPTSYVRLAGYPVRKIIDVKIDGVSIPEAPVDSGDGIHFGGWRLDRWRRLTRMSIPGPPVIPQTWPACQDFTLADTQPGTFSITYQHGVDPPLLGKQAAAQLACQLFVACGTEGECVLPQGVTSIDRQGIRIERALLSNWFDRTKPTGLVALDGFLEAYWCTRTGRRPAVFSPDLQAYPLRISTTIPPAGS